MSEFNQAIEAARRKQRWLTLFVLIGFIVIVLLLVMVVFASRGTRIEVLPTEITQQAQVSTEQGMAVVIFSHLYSLSPLAEIKAQAPGFLPTTAKISQADFGKVTTITLKPLPGELKLTTSANADRTRWLLNGELADVANRFEKTLKAGDYAISVNHPYYQPASRTYTLGRGELVTEQIELSPIERAVTIDSSPKGASVAVDGNELGVTPLSLMLAGGRHAVEITKPGFDPTIDEVEIKNTDTKIARNYQLSAKKAGVNITVSPAGGTLLQNGSPVAITSRVNIKAGHKTTLTYSKPGYLPQSQTLTLAADERRDIAFSLQKEMGEIEINATPRATVTINGKIEGQTPLKRSLQAVAQQIELSLAGYRSVTKTVTPSAKSPSKLSVTLVPEEKARLLEAPKSYRTKAGGEMVLFTPNDKVRMGAPRGEPGQRANEFMKTAILDRPFYAGRHEVTNAAYAQFKPGHKGTGNLPVTSVSWFDAIQYANWLSQAENLQAVYEIKGGQLQAIHNEADGYRLLTEAEWEWLARKAGRPNQTQFVWGNDKTLPAKAANIADESSKGSVSMFVPRYDDGKAGIAPVMSMQRELSGLFDMGGNVSEWTHDSYQLSVPQKDTVFPHVLDTATSGMRVVKGANWRSGSLTELRASYREGLVETRDDLGFRLGRFLFGGNK
jgi:formylglycine-generating enzyme required for sulfatase activity